MSFADERAAIEGRFSSQYGNTTPIQYENVKFTRPATSWVRLQIVNGEGDRISLGDNPQIFRSEGVIVVTIFTQEDTGTKEARELADVVDGIFREAVFSSGNSGLIRCRVPRIEPIGTREGWYQLQVLTEYIRDKFQE
jgi:hypothetical protein